MRFSITAILCILCASLGWLAGCRTDAPERPQGPVRVVVTLPPLAGLAEPLVEAVGGELAVLMPPGASPHGFELTPGNLRDIARADLMVLVGLGMEPAVERALANGRIGVLSFADAAGIDGHAHHDNNAPAHEHDEDCHVDAHLWLDPGMVERLIPELARAIRDTATASGAWSDGQIGALQQAEKELLSRIRALDAEARAQLAPHAGRAIVTHHNAWSRLAERYGLRVAGVIRPVEAAEPTPDEITAAVRSMRDDGVGAVFVEPQFERTFVAKAAERAGLPVAVLDPIGDGDWFAMMRRNVDSIAIALAGSAP